VNVEDFRRRGKLDAKFGQHGQLPQPSTERFKLLT
jgi:hypothetical protein